MKLVGERRAIAVLVFSLYFVMFLMNALLGAEETKGMLLALAGCYGLAVWSLSAGYFWARWYAVGTGIFGLILGVVGCWQSKALEPIFVFVGGTHAVAAFALWGESMAGSFDGQLAWREKFHMDENAVQRLGRSVIRAGVSLPFVLVYALAPKPNAAAFVALGLALTGFAGIVKMRTWGLLATAASGVTLLAFAQPHLVCPHMFPQVMAPFAPVVALSPTAIGIVMLSALVPFAGPMVRWIRTR